ncbi:ICE1 protein, partial [Atractosteus spatula]|nr:ICE1 protein [Atractosteus spatula]
RETSSLHHQLDELFLKLTPLEKQNEEFEAMKSELEEKRSSLKLCQQTLLESESLKEEIRKTESVKKQLEDKVKKLEDAGEKQGQELKQLKMEKNMLEKELDKTQSSLKLFQQMRLDYENQKEEISKTESVKKELEDKVKKLEDTRASQSQEIKQLKMERNMLEKELQKTQFNLEKLEEENRQKDVRSASVQTNVPEETGVKIDQTKVRMLLQELWMCLEPSSQISQSTDRQHFPFKETGLHRKTSNPHPCVHPTMSKSPLKHQIQNNQPLFHRSPSEDLQCYELVRFQSNSSKSPVFPVPESAGTMHKKGKRKRKRYSGKSEEDVHIEADLSEGSKELTVNDNVSEQLEFLSNEEKECSPLIRGDIEEVLECFKPLPPVLSPLNLSLPNSQDSLFGYMSDSSDEEKGVRFCDGTEEKDKTLSEKSDPSGMKEYYEEYMEIEQSKLEVSEMDTECSLAEETEIHKKQPSSPLCTAERKLQETDKTDIVCSIGNDREVCSAQDMLFQTAPANADCKEKESTGSCLRVSERLQEHSETEEQFTKCNTTEQEPESEIEQTVLKDSADGSLPKHENLRELNSCEESCKEVNSEHPEEESFVDYLKVQTSASDSTKNISPQNNSSLSEDEMEQTKRKITVMENCHVLQKLQTTEPSVKQNIDTLIESVPSSDITQCVKGEMMSTDKGTVEGPLCGLPVDSDKGLCEFQETESEKINELDSSNPESLQHDAECSGGTDRGVPLGSDLSILDELSSGQNLLKDADNADKEAINQTCSNGNPNVSKNDMSSVEQKVKDEKIMKESRSNDSLEETDSSDDQEGCILQRKVKTSQRAESHDSNEKANTVLHSHQDFTKLEDPLPENVRVTSNESESQSISVMSKNTFPSLGDNSDLQQCVSTDGINSDVPKGNKQVDESEPESTSKISGTCLFDNDIKTSNDCEVTGDEKDLNESKACGLANILLESRNITEANNLSSGIPKLPSQSVLESESDTHHRYEKCNESALRKVTEAVSVNAPECMNRNGEIATPEVCPLSAVKTVTSNDSTVPDCTRPQPFSAEDGVKRKIIHADPPVQATADTPLSPKPSPESIKKVRSKMGPPLPPLLQPLPATPPASRKRLSPSKSSSSRLFCPSPVDEQVSTLKETPATSITSPLSNEPNKSPFWATPSPSDVCKSRVVSSPLQFCATTPKHALPVPGRLPPSALASSTSSNLPQENSVRILDSMYPELSARAITLNILRGNVCLNRGMPGTGNTAPRSANQISGFKAINSSTTAFTKTGKACESKGSSFQHPSDNSEICDSGLLELLDRESRLRNQGHNLQSVEKEADVKKTPSHNPPEAILNALKKIENSCFDLLPVIRSHIHVGKIPQVPVLRDEEREVIHGFCVVNKHLAEDLLSSILTKMKSEKNTLESNHLQALCRVYVGICRQQGDLERARVFAYSILKEDFPDSAKMILFITATWSNIFSFPGLINKSIQALAKQRAEGEVLQCLTAYLGWEKSPPCDIIKLLSSTLIVLQMGVNMKFQDNERHGEDLSPCVWEYVFALELLCSHQNWTWIHDIFLRKHTGPIFSGAMMCRVGQMGLRQRAVVSVKNVAKVINTFCRHANAEGVPWGVQLAAVYAIYDLAPSNPKEALEALATWREATTRPVPPAVTSCIMQIGFMLRQMK